MEKDFERLLEEYACDCHKTTKTLINTASGLTKGQQEDMFEYLRKYILDVRFRKKNRTVMTGTIFSIR